MLNIHGMENGKAIRCKLTFKISLRKSAVETKR